MLCGAVYKTNKLDVAANNAGLMAQRLGNGYRSVYGEFRVTAEEGSGELRPQPSGSHPQLLDSSTRIGLLSQVVIHKEGAAMFATAIAKEQVKAAEPAR